MDFDLDSDQSAIMESVARLLEEHAGASRAVDLHARGAYDDDLHRALAEAGFLDVAGEGGMGLLEAVLVTEAVAGAGGVVAAGACSVLAAATALEGQRPVALVEADTLHSPVRYLSASSTLISIEADSVKRLELEAGDVEAVDSNFGYPMGRLRSGCEPDRIELDIAPARALDLWRLALSAEAVGTMEAALAQTVEYLKQRRQFGRSIGSFQAVQHRLADCAIQLEAARWLVREAAHYDAPSEAVATAAGYAVAAGEQVFRETHQLSGAIGFTREHDLHVWSMRLQALRLELGGVRAHRRAIAAARWGSTIA